MIVMLLLKVMMMAVVEVVLSVMVLLCFQMRYSRVGVVGNCGNAFSGAL
jgi:hypothetical protein